MVITNSGQIQKSKGKYKTGGGVSTQSLPRDQTKRPRVDLDYADNRQAKLTLILFLTDQRNDQNKIS